MPIEVSCLINIKVIFKYLGFIVNEIKWSCCENYIGETVTNATVKIMDIKTSKMSKAAENLELCPDHIFLWSALLRAL